MDINKHTGQENINGEVGRRYRPRRADVYTHSAKSNRHKPTAEQGDAKGTTGSPLEESLEAVRHKMTMNETLPKKQIRKPRDHPASASPALPRMTRSFVLKRQMVTNAQKQRSKTRKVHIKQILLIIGATVVVSAALVIAWSFKDLVFSRLHLFRQSPAQTVQPPAVLPESNNTSLDESEVSAEQIAQNKMGPLEPNTLNIPALNTTARVKRVGRSLGAEPVTPKNIFDAGWFEGSSMPGDQGAVLLNGHIVGQSKKGLFANLHLLSAGDEIVLQRGDGTTINYHVVKMQEYSLEEIDMVAAKQSIDPTKQGLNLMTSRTKYSSQSGQKRVIVFAVRSN